MKLKQWSLAALMLAAAGCDSNTNDALVIDNDAIGADGGGATAGQTGGPSTGGSDGTSAGNGDSDGNCKEYVVRNEQVTPDILIVLDRSGSMDTEGKGRPGDRWTGSVNAIVSSTNTYNSQISFGLMAYPDDGSCGSTNVAVPIKANAAAEIKAALDAMQPRGGTPTLSALKRAREEISKGSVAIDGIPKPKVVLLVTDGAPSCDGATGFPTIPPECIPDPLAPACIAAVAAAAMVPADAELMKKIVADVTTMAAEGTRTYVIGYETAGTGFATNLDAMAAAGGTALMTHTSVASEQELNGVLQSMISNAVSCTFGLEEAPKDPSYVQVSVDGVQLNLDQPDGWKLGADGKSVEVQGAACMKLQDGAGQHTLSVVVKCDVVPII